MRRLKILRGSAFIAGVVLGTLIVLLGPEFFYAIPWPVRKAGGWTVCAAIAVACAARLLSSRPDPALNDPEDRQLADRWLPWVLASTGAAFAIPLLRHPENLGFGDWDLFLGKHEAARRTIVLWRQFPWWDPWTRGGFPLAANPQCGVVSIAMPFMLCFGTSVGMRIATIVCFLLAAEGTRRLARLWIDDPYAAAAAGLIYALNGGVLVAAVAAYHVTMCYPVLPWMLFHVFRLERRPTQGLWLGFWAALLLLNGIQYFTVYIALIAGLAWVRATRTRSGADRRRFLAHTVLAAGTFFALAGWRVATTGLVYRDFPRNYQSWIAENPWRMLLYMLNRPTGAQLVTASVPYYWETFWYLGPVVVILAAFSLLYGWRWWHTLTFWCTWLALGSITWYYPSYWLAHFPFFSTMHVVTRWRFMATLGIALAAASVIAAWRTSERRILRVLAYLAIVAIAADYLTYGFDVLPVAFSIAPTEDRFPGPPLPRSEIVQVAETMGFPSILRGYGVILGFEPLMGYDRHATTARVWRGHPDYIAEHWTARGPVRPLYWSPNRIELKVEPGEVVWINQNPGSWWLVNGRREFSAMRCAEKERTFAVRADQNGRVLLTIRPRGLDAGISMHVVGLVTVVSVWILVRRTARPEGKRA